MCCPIYSRWQLLQFVPYGLQIRHIHQDMPQCSRKAEYLDSKTNTKASNYIGNHLCTVLLKARYRLWQQIY